MTREQFTNSIHGKLQAAHFVLADQEDCCMAVGREFGFGSDAYAQERAIEQELFTKWAQLFRQVYPHYRG